MIPRFLRPEVWPYASVEVIPAPEPPSEFWVRLRYHATRHEETYTEKTAANRATLIILTSGYADVVAQGEQ